MNEKGNMYSDTFVWNKQKIYIDCINNTNMNLNNNFNVNLDYIAGFFDGEGSVMIKISRDKKRKYKVFLGGIIQIVQTNKEILERIRDFLGYGYILTRSHKKHPHWKPTTTLQIQNEEQCRDFIKKMKNRTYRKHKQLIVLEDFYNTRKELKNSLFYSKENALKLLEYAEKIQILNDHNKITENLKNIKQRIIDFDEKGYLENMEKIMLERGKRIAIYSKKYLKIKILKEELEDLYINQKLSCPKIAKIYNCNKVTIQRRLKEYNIPMRNQRIKISKKELEDLYLTKKLSCQKISEIYRCNPRTINRKLNKYKIPTRVGGSHE